MMYGSARAVEHRTHQNSVAVAEHQDSKNKGELIRDYLMRFKQSGHMLVKVGKKTY